MSIYPWNNLCTSEEWNYRDGLTSKSIPVCDPVIWLASSGSHAFLPTSKSCRGVVLQGIWAALVRSKKGWVLAEKSANEWYIGYATYMTLKKQKPKKKKKSPDFAGSNPNFFIWPLLTLLTSCPYPPPVGRTILPSWPTLFPQWLREVPRRKMKTCQDTIGRIVVYFWCFG